MNHKVKAITMLPKSSSLFQTTNFHFYDQRLTHAHWFDRIPRLRKLKSELIEGVTHERGVMGTNSRSQLFQEKILYRFEEFQMPGKWGECLSPMF